MDPPESSATAAIAGDDTSLCVKSTSCRTDATGSSHLLLDAGTTTTTTSSSLTATSSSSSINSPPAPPPPSPIPARAAGQRKSSASSIHKSSHPPHDDPQSTADCSLIHDSHASSSLHHQTDPCSSETGHRSVPDVALTQSAVHVLPDTPPDQEDEEEEMDQQSDEDQGKQKSAYYQNLLEATCQSLEHRGLQNQRLQSPPASMSPADRKSDAASASSVPPEVACSSSSSQPDVIAHSSASVQQQHRHDDDDPQLGAIADKLVDEERDEKGIYRLKWFDCKKSGNEKDKDRIAIITQNENGPCPLIAIMNVLLLKGDVRVPKVMDVITADQLMEFLGDNILTNMPKNLSNGAQLNYEQNMMDAIAILPKLQTGLDVNVRFTSVTDFEFTPELIVFDLLRIPLYHGWLVDPVVDAEAAVAIGSCSYNQLVDKIINNQCSEKTVLVTEALQAEHFLETTATQLTYYGLEELLSHVNEDEPCVLFRNNHFITLYKRKNCLYQLVTDQGFINESNVIWETLNNIEGDGEFVDQEFVLVPPKKMSPSMEFMSAEEVKQQEDQDYLLALSLQEEYKKELEQMKEWERDKAESGMVQLSDEELARRLQQEEEEKHQQKQQQNQPHASSFSKNTTASHHQHHSQQSLHHQMRNLKITDSSSGGGSSRSNDGRAGSSGSQHHLSDHRQDDRSGSRSGTTSQHQHHHQHHHHHVQHEQRDSVMPENISQRSQLVRPSSGQSMSRRRTSSDSFATDSHNRGSPAGGGRASHSEGGNVGSNDGSDSHRDHRRNKSSCLLQ